MSSFFAQNWQYLTALMGGAFASWRFLISRRDELAWKRTEFLFDQARYLEADANMREILQILGDNHSDYGIVDIVDNEADLKDSEKYRLRNNLDHFLNFFDRLYYAYASAGTMSKAEVMVFEWYLSEILETEYLATYCESNGFRDVLKLAKIVKGDT